MKSTKEKLTNLICALGVTQANIEVLLERRYIPKRRLRTILLLQKQILKEISIINEQNTNIG